MITREQLAAWREDCAAVTTAINNFGTALDEIERLRAEVFRVREELDYPTRLSALNKENAESARVYQMERDQARAERNGLRAEVVRLRSAVRCATMDPATTNIECAAMQCSKVTAIVTLHETKWDVNRNGLWFCGEHAENARSPEEHALAGTKT